MSPEEVWWYVEAFRPRPMFGSLTEEQAAQIYAEDFGPIDGE